MAMFDTVSRVLQLVDFRLKVGRHPVLSLHLSNEKVELSQWLYRVMMTAL